MTTLMFYERAVPLNRKRHLKTKIEIAPNHYAFAARTNALPIASTELNDAARYYPIVFVGKEKGSFNIAALVGLNNQENLMVNPDGIWEAGTYIPAFARRYPFVLATTNDQDKFTVCVDEAYPGLSEGKGTALFDEKGAESAYLKGVLEFLQAFHREMQRTSAFANRMHELGLLTPKTITVDRKGKKQFLEGLWVIDDAKLGGLDDTRVAELYRLGHLHWISAHRISLGNLAGLATRLDEHSQLTDEKATAEEPA